MNAAVTWAMRSLVAASFALYLVAPSGVRAAETCAVRIVTIPNPLGRPWSLKYTFYYCYDGTQVVSVVSRHVTMFGSPGDKIDFVSYADPIYEGVPGHGSRWKVILSAIVRAKHCTGCNCEVEGTLVAPTVSGDAEGNAQLEGVAEGIP
jgi:hypothetical protein